MCLMLICEAISTGKSFEMAGSDLNITSGCNHHVKASSLATVLPQQRPLTEE